MKHFITTVLSIAAFMMALTLSAGTRVYVNGLYYNIEGGKAEVTSMASGKYNGDINIPSHITYDGNHYPVTSIGERAFAFCDSITSVRIPNTVESIGSEAFNRCYGLRHIDLPTSVKKIDAMAFLWCKELQSIGIPETVEDINPSAFYCCHGLETIDGIRYAGTFLVEVADKERESYTIKDGTRWIGVNALSNLPNVKQLVVPASVKYIPPFAFSGCSQLTEVKLSEGVAIVGDCAFSSCTQIESITLPSTIKQITSDCFAGCEKLGRITCTSEVPPFVEVAETQTDDGFYRFDASKCSLYVPKSAMKQYDEAKCWKTFGTIKQN